MVPPGSDRSGAFFGGEMSSTPACRVREAAGTLTTPGRLDLRAITACARELDTALRASGAEGDAAAAEFCSGPPGEPARSALRWCAGVLHRGVPEGANPTDVKGATPVGAPALLSGADWREQFGHVTRSGAHSSRPARGAALIARPWNPDLHAPTGILLRSSPSPDPSPADRRSDSAPAARRKHRARPTRPEMVLAVGQPLRQGLGRDRDRPHGRGDQRVHIHPRVIPR